MRSSKTGQYNLKDKKAQLYSGVSVSTPGLMHKTYYVANDPRAYLVLYQAAKPKSYLGGGAVRRTIETLAFRVQPGKPGNSVMTTFTTVTNGMR